MPFPPRLRSTQRVIAMSKFSPLHKVIDAGRWDAEGLLGRLIVLVHAAFLDAGFAPLSLVGRQRGPVPKEAGSTASALSLRYTAPQLLHQQDDADAAAVLRHQVYGRKIVLYVQLAGWLRPVASSWEVVDALDAARLISGGLDATARALRRDPRLAALWRSLADGLCRRALVDLCRRNGVALEPTFMSLPDDVKAAILARLTDGKDLAQVERTCTAMRRLAAERDRELWKPLYDELDYPLFFRDTSDLPDLSWKERYVRARRSASLFFSWREMQVIRNRPRYGFYVPSYYDSLIHAFDLSDRYHDTLIRPFDLFDRDDDPPDLPADPVTERRKRTAAARGRRGQTPRGQGKRRQGAGAIHAPSSRYRWKHR